MAGGLDLVVGTAVKNHPQLFEDARSAFEESRLHCEGSMSAHAIDLHLMVAPDECIPQWGVGGFTFGPHAVLVTVDPEVEISRDDLVSTMVHEIHHAIRWRAPGCGTALGERLVSEGLAQVFEVECTGRRPLYGRGAVERQWRDLALAEATEDPADEGRWFFGSGEVPFWFGYRLGYHLMVDALRSAGLTAAEAVHLPASTLLGAVVD